MYKSPIFANGLTIFFYFIFWSTFGEKSTFLFSNAQSSTIFIQFPPFFLCDPIYVGEHKVNCKPVNYSSPSCERKTEKLTKKNPRNIENCKLFTSISRTLFNWKTLFCFTWHVKHEIYAPWAVKRKFDTENKNMLPWIYSIWVLTRAVALQPDLVILYNCPFKLPQYSHL